MTRPFFNRSSLLVSSAIAVGLQLVPVPVRSPLVTLLGGSDLPALASAPTPPSNLGEPGGRSEAGSRGCSTDGSPISPDEGTLTALVPVVDVNGDETVWGITASARPTFWVYVPPSLMMGEGEFVIEDDTTQWTYPVVLDGPSGIVQVSIPETGPSLAPDIDYHWYFNIYCQPEQPPFFVHGWIRRINLDPSLQQALAQASPAQQAELYADNGLWYDALAAARGLGTTDPTHAVWASLLQGLDLGHLVERPLVNCCTLGANQSQLPINTYGDQ